MLAQPGAPFDSDDHLFEIKWDGTRMLVVRDADDYRLVNRHRAEPGRHRQAGRGLPSLAGIFARR